MKIKTYLKNNKKMLINKQLEMGHARALLPLSQEQQLEAARKITNQGLSVRLTEKLVKDIQNPPPKIEP